MGSRAAVRGALRPRPRIVIDRTAVGPTSAAVYQQTSHLHRLVVTATFVESLFVQDEHGPEGTERRAEWLREYVAEMLAELDGEAG